MFHFSIEDTMEVKINQIGRIVAGDEVGAYVKVVDDIENTGGYLVLTSVDRNMQDCFDSWVENKDALSRYFTESDWSIQWL
jgi:hypothetical protein